jgi:UDP-N-acetylglucosamine 1-carboxyvinyltransferase
MERIRISGGPDLSLRGNVRVSGSKNAVLPAIAAALLTEDYLRLTNVPLVRDVYSMITLLRELGAETDLKENAIEVRAKNLLREEASYDLVKLMRASILVLGPLVARFGKALVALPGGCAIGSRPIDLHMSGLQKLGATITLEHGYIKAEAPRLQGAEIHFEKTTVGGTENLVMAAALARGETILRNCAREPEVQCLCELLVKMGAKISGIGEETIRITGVDSLGGAAHEIIPDRIEAGTYMVAGALTKGDIVLHGVRPDHLITTIDKLRYSGAHVDILGADRLRVVGPSVITPQDITTSPFPGFPTDMQAQFMVLMTQAAGTSIITETIFDRRFQHVNELLRLGASIDVSGDKAIVRGPTPLSGAEVTASDLRASAGLLLAGLVAGGETIVNEVEHIDRGYEAIEAKLRQLGARIERIKD